MTLAKPHRAAPEGTRSIRQPGPPAPERIQWVEARGRAFKLLVAQLQMRSDSSTRLPSGSRR